jgi:acetylornithine/N-succinyldiaminopimelate aminotransferase
MPAGYIQGLRELADARNLLLILDEIQTGIGRTGKMFAYEHEGIEPDIMTLGKGLGGGVPLGALTAKEKISCFVPGDQGGTFNGNALVTAAGTVVLDIVGQPEFLDEVTAKGEYLRKRLAELATRYGHGETQGRGLLIGWTLRTQNAAEIVKRAFENRLLLNAPRPDILRFMPALTVAREEIDTMISTLADVLPV